MDPVSIVVSALAAGAAAALKPTAEQAVKDAYSGLKALIQRKYKSVTLEGVEKKPGSEAKQASVAEDLADAGSADDEELLAQANMLIKAVKTHAPETAAAIGVDLEAVEAAYLKIGKVSASGTGVKIRDGKFTDGGIDIGKVEAGVPVKKQ